MKHVFSDIHSFLNMLIILNFVLLVIYLLNNGFDKKRCSDLSIDLKTQTSYSNGVCFIKRNDGWYML